jgi:Flp pilus assembly protein TadB
MADRHQSEFFASAGAARARAPEAAISERSTVEIVKDIVGNVQEIIRSEIRLATAEMREKAVQAGKASALLAVGAIVGLYAVAFFLVTIYNALSLVMWAWVSALIIGVVLAVAAGSMLLAGRKKLQRVRPKPEQTVETIREDIEWIKNRKR